MNKQTYTWSRSLMVLVLCLIAAVLTACSRTEEPTITVPAGAQAGDLTMESCTFEIGRESYVGECGILTVPENRSDPNSRLIALPVKRIRATEKNTRPIFDLEGGPGRPNMPGQIPAWLNRNHDLVMVGYRGVEGSIDLDLPEFSEALGGVSDDLLDDESLDAMSDAVAAGAARLQGEGVDLAGYTIPEVVADMEAARVALGYERINLYSHSYGTRVAQLYSWLYPDSLFRVVMLSVNPPGRMVWEPQMIDEQLAYYADLCVHDNECNGRTPDLVATVKNVFDNMPARWGLLPIDAGRVKFATFQLLGDTSSANLIFDAIMAAEEGDPAGLATISLGYIFNFDVPHSLNWGNSAAIAHSADYDPQRDYRADMSDSNSIMGSPASLVQWGTAEKWPYTPISADLRQSQFSDVETLVVGGSIDFLTPITYVEEELLPYLNKGQMVVVSESGHNGFSMQEEAFAQLITTFYDNGVGDDSLYEYQPMQWAVEQSLGDLGRSLVRNFVIYPLVAILVVAILIVLVIRWSKRRRIDSGN